MEHREKVFQEFAASSNLSDKNSLVDVGDTLQLQVVVIRTMGSLQVKVSVEDCEVVALLDSGAAVTCVDESLVSQLEHSPIRNLTLRTANNSRLQIVGRVNVNLKINNVTFSLPMVSVRGLSAPCILGNDFSVNQGVTIAYATREVFLTHETGEVRVPFYNIDFTFEKETETPEIMNILSDDVESTTLLVADEDVIIEGRDHAFCSFCKSGEDQSGVCIFEPNNDILTNKDLLIHPTLFDNTQHGKLLVLNPTLRRRSISKGLILGKVTPVLEIGPNKDIAVSDNEFHMSAVDVTPSEEKDVTGKVDINPNLSPDQTKAMVELLNSHYDQFAWSLDGMKQARVEGCEFELLSTKPVHKPPYRCSAKERLIIQEQIDQMSKKGVIRPSRSSYASPVVLVKKKSGEWRFCVDYRTVNTIIKPDSYPLPLIDDILTYLSGSMFFSTLDMFSGYWQLAVAEECRHITAFVTPDGLWEFNALPFGLSVSPALFQRAIDKVLAGLKWNTALCYLDDIVTMGPTFEIHLQRLEAVLNRFREFNLSLNPSKCTFGYSEIKILGHVVNEIGLAPSPDKIKAVSEFPTPKKLKDVRSFLGLANFYRKFILNFSMLARPLTELTKKNVKFIWDTEQQEAFQLLKEKLISAPILRHFSDNRPIQVHTDASQFGVGAILMQEFEDGLHPVSYASKKFSIPEQRYNTTQQELLAIVYAVRTFRPYLYGRFFTVVSDHAALCYLNNNTEATGRLARWSIMLQDFNFVVKHKAGVLHMGPDSLSRYPLDDGTTVEGLGDEDKMEFKIFALQITDIARLQDTDETLKEIRDAIKNPDHATSKARRQSRSFVLDKDILYKKNFAQRGHEKLLVIPESLKYEVMYNAHDAVTAGHFGFIRTLGRLKGKYFWFNMVKEVENYVKSCPCCQSRKNPTQRPAGLLNPIPVNSVPFTLIGIDLLGPMPKTASGKTFIICCTDYTTKWAITGCLSSGNAPDVADFIVKSVICKHGVPSTILSDRGATFRSNLVRGILEGLGSRPTFTTSYHAATNGLTERFNGTLTTSLSLYVSSTHKDWDDFIDLITFAYNTSVQETTKSTPFMLIYGREATLPIDVSLLQGLEISEDAAEVVRRLNEARRLVVDRVKKAQEKQKARFDSGRREVRYNPGQWVKIHSPLRQVGRSDKLQKRWQGPYKVLKRLSDLNYEVEIKKGRKLVKDVVHVIRMKPYYSPDKWRIKDLMVP